MERIANRNIIRRVIAAVLLLGLPLTLLAAQSLLAADSDDSPTPSPSPHTRKHTHPHLSPTPTPTLKKFYSDDDSEPDVTPAAKKKHHHPVDTDDSDASPTPKPTPSPADSDSDTTPTPKPHPSMAPDASLDTDQLQDFSQQPPKIQALIETSLALTRQNLTYTFSSDDPANGGMDCSGFIYYVLTQAGLKDVPRDASEQYSWVRKAEKFRAVISRRLDGFELDELKPGDLLFWSGTYKTDRDPPVTHAMIYLGREAGTGNRVMVGSSDGRSYHGLQRWGVSVFDFKPASTASPSPNHAAPQFIGYGAIPGL
jgi:cell wall-associated NlpC family hydrolase